MKLTIYEGHVLDQLKKIASNSVDCICTSPPYWGLRSYKGAEAVFDGYLQKAGVTCNEHKWGEIISERVDETGFEHDQTP